MANYWYKVELSRAVTIEERRRAKAELQRLFQSAEMPIGDGFVFEVMSPLGPVAADVALTQFAVKFGKATIMGGSKLK